MLKFKNFEKIKRAYKKKALKYHPDRSKHLDEATRIIYEDNFKLISTIYKNIDDIVNPLKGGRYKKKYNKKYNKINKKLKIIVTRRLIGRKELWN